MPMSTTVPLISGTRALGLYQVCTDANTDYAIAIPSGATGVILWFSTSAADNTMIRGRVGVDDANTTVTGLTGTDDNLGYFPPIPVEIRFRTVDHPRSTTSNKDTYLHVASSTALAVVRGTWLFAHN